MNEFGFALVELLLSLIELSDRSYTEEGDVQDLLLIRLHSENRKFFDS
jgi:hypothetical protein